MKRFTAIFLCVCMILSTCVIASFAAEREVDTDLVLVSRTVEYFEDGSSLVTEVYQGETSTSSVQGARDVNQTYGSKKSRKYDAVGNELYSLTVNGTFTYNGAFATATNATYSKVINKNLYTLRNASTSCYGNYASATGNFYDTLGNFHSTLNPILSCDAYGNLS